MTEQQIETSTQSQVAETTVKRAIFKAIIAPSFWQVLSFSTFTANNEIINFLVKIILSSDYLSYML